jgi:hypothetical protein
MNISDQLTEEEEKKRGEAIVLVLALKEARDIESGKRFNPPRYHTEHGTKTALGLFRTLAPFYTK